MAKDAKMQELLDRGHDPRGFSEDHVLTELGSHVASQRGYAENRIIERSEPVPAGIPIASEWMVPADEAEPADAEAESADAEAESEA